MGIVRKKISHYLGSVAGLYPSNKMTLVRDNIRWWKVWRTVPVKVWVDAAVSFRAKDYRRAANLYREGIERFPKHPAIDCAHLDYAYSLLRMGQHSEAVEILENLCAKDVELPEAHLLLAQQYVMCEKFIEAIHLLRRAYRNFPDEVSLLAGYALAAWYNGFKFEDDKEVEYALTVARNRLKDRGRDWSNITTALAVRSLQKGQYEECESFLAQVYSCEYVPIEAFLLTYSKLSKREQFELALDQIHRASRVAPTDPRPIYELAKHISSANDSQTLGHAHQLAKRACELAFFRSPSAVSLLSDIEARMGNEQEAEIYEIHSLMLSSERDINFQDFGSFQIQQQRMRRA